MLARATLNSGEKGDREETPGQVGSTEKLQEMIGIFGDLGRVKLRRLIRVLTVCPESEPSPQQDRTCYRRHRDRWETLTSCRKSKEFLVGCVLHTDTRFNRV